MTSHRSCAANVWPAALAGPPIDEPALDALLHVEIEVALNAAVIPQDQVKATAGAIGVH